MASSSLFKPGILQGIYPEKNDAAMSVWDRSLSRLQNIVNQAVKHKQDTLQAVARAVVAYRFEALSEEELDLRIKKIKSTLHLRGFEDAAVIEAFAVIREVARRQIGMAHFESQLIGGWVMLKGMIAEMETGEGKTLTATLPACTAAMAGIPVHVVTVNDYLVKRDAELMGPIYRALGLTCGTITEGMDSAQRRSAYACDITYCSNKQLTFDYLKDRIVLGRKNSRLQLQLNQIMTQHQSIANRLLLRGLCFAIIDEADSVLIDESRTPLILSRENQSTFQLLVYQQALHIAGELRLNADFIIHRRNRSIELTAAGKSKVERLSKPLGGVWSAARRARELVTQALSAQHLYLKNIHYLVRDGKILIIDEFTGRVMPDRSWERGLHQMIETKEDCAMSDQKETIARISYQLFFRRYLHLTGMTGTAREVRNELFSVYQIPVVRIPTHKPVKRKQLPSRYFCSSNRKWAAIVDRVVELYTEGRPVLVGTRSVEDSEHLGNLLMLQGLPHNILNARQDADEAAIVQHAGQPKCITVATNMAGRGTDIKLAPGVNEMGGLHVILTECHEAGRIDRQLFGRCGRQGDAGSYERFLSLEDELIRKYGLRPFVFLARKLEGIHPALFGAAAEINFRWAQAKAERYQAAIRYGLLKKDANLQQLLAFSGKSE
jgi:preprotein translocase subunit SecA